MELEKLAVPLTIVASVIAVAVFLRGGKTAATVGTVPLSAKIPSFANIPAITYNVATPQSTPITLGSSYVPFVPPNGIITNNWFGAPFDASDLATANGSDNCGCGCNGSKLVRGRVTPYFNTVLQTAEL